MFETKIRVKESKMSSTYRLTSPLRLFRGLLIVLLATAFAVSGFTGSVAIDQGSTPTSFEYITVYPGDSLWALARVHSTGDPRDWIIEAMRLNGLSSHELTPGQQLALP